MDTRLRQYNQEQKLIALFDQLVEKIVPISNTELLFKLKCGLELKEVIPQ